MVLDDGSLALRAPLELAATGEQHPDRLVTIQDRQPGAATPSPEPGVSVGPTGSSQRGQIGSHSRRIRNHYSPREGTLEGPPRVPSCAGLIRRSLR